jgi:hypothetical protein
MRGSGSGSPAVHLSALERLGNSTTLTKVGSVAGIEMYVTRVNSDLSVDCRNPPFYVRLCIWQSNCVIHPL